MLARCGKILVVIALVLTTGLHWAALQTVAWTTMFANNLCSDNFSCAVSRTFDGKHPCCLCKAIAAAKQQQKKSETIAPAVRLEFPPAAKKAVLFPPTQFEMLPLGDAVADSLPSKPPVPPPRSFPV